jgi:hypothetical protein
VADWPLEAHPLTELPSTWLPCMMHLSPPQPSAARTATATRALLMLSNQIVLSSTVPMSASRGGCASSRIASPQFVSVCRVNGVGQAWV